MMNSRGKNISILKEEIVLSDQVILNENSFGIRMIRTDKVRRSCVDVVNEDGYRHVRYRMNNIPFYEHPLLSWKNLDYVGGWRIAEKDEAYLYTAVQQEHKLMALFTVPLYEVECPDTEKNLRSIVEEKLKAMCPGLDESHELWRITSVSRNYYGTYCNVTILRRGCLADFFDVKEIVGAYHRQSFDIVAQEDLEPFFHTELSDLFPEQEQPASPSNYFVRSILTGLVLGYPIESTVSLLNGYH